MLLGNCMFLAAKEVVISCVFQPLYCHLQDTMLVASDDIVLVCYAVTMKWMPLIEPVAYHVYDWAIPAHKA